MSIITVAQIREFIKDHLHEVIKVDVECLKEKSPRKAFDVFIETPSDEVKNNVLLREFILDLVDLLGLEFYLIKPHNLPGIKSRSGGRPKGAVNKKSKDKKDKCVRPTHSNNVKKSIKNNTVIESDGILVTSMPSPHTKEDETCAACGFKGKFTIEFGYKFCPKCNFCP